MQGYLKFFGISMNNIIKKILHNNLNLFTLRSLQTISPQAQFQQNWHLDMIHYYLNKIMKGETRRLIINMPPRYMKSICISVSWPAWILGHDPTKKIIAASYSQAISNKHSQDCRLIVSSSWYKSVFQEAKIVQGENQKSKFVTTKRGFRLASSTGGSITGEGGDILILDDPQNPSKINSTKYRNNTIEWFEQTFVSRLNNKKDGAIVIVMQRLHENDLCGYLLENKKDQWDLLKIPAIFEEETIYNGPYKLIADEGAVLHEERENLDVLMRLRKELGEYNFAAQYNQNPMPAKGTMVKSDWLRFYNKEDKISFSRIIQSWDTAIKAKDEHDYSVGITLGLHENAYYIIDVFRKKLEFPDLLLAIKDSALKWRPSAILIEDKASGQSLIQSLKNSLKIPLIAIKPKNDKITRFAKHTPKIESGKLHILQNTAWKEVFEKEILSFPRSSNDDQVDALSQAFEYLENNVLLQVRSL